MLIRSAPGCDRVKALHPLRQSLRSIVTPLHFPSAYEWRDMLLSPQCGVDRGDKLLTRRELQHVPQGTGGEAFLHQRCVVVDSHKHGANPGMPPQDLACGRDAVEAWQRNVGDNDIWDERCGCGNECVAITNGSDDVELRLQYCTQAFCNRQMV